MNKYIVFSTSLTGFVVVHVCVVVINGLQLDFYLLIILLEHFRFFDLKIVTKKRDGNLIYNSFSRVTLNR